MGESLYCQARKGMEPLPQSIHRDVPELTIGARITRSFNCDTAGIPSITKQMLTQQLCELEPDGLPDRTVFPEVPPRVDYALTEKWRSLFPVIAAMRD